MQNDFMIKCGDGKLIAATHYGDEGLPMVIVSSALGTSRRFYDAFAKFLLQKGFQVLTFDYRGVGDSKSRKDDPDVKVSKWGSEDLTAVINWVKTYEPDQWIALVGHSIAGQIFPLAKNKKEVQAAYFVASQTASAYYWDSAHRWKVEVFWNLLFPATTNLTGKLPSWAYGGKYDIPKFAAMEWAEWGKHVNGVLQNSENRIRAFRDTQIPLRFISMDDDKILAPKRAVERLMEQYGGSRKEHHHWYASDFNKRKIGHFGFFQKENFEMWDDVHLWLKRYV
ncbi:alpha/beta fold hydrolase [Ekhidna sp.]|uniref:alpha/beta hydrolase family protein n=1 Tax=Ekhidna sp. TaxID=2608089 RepID=UPI003B58C6BA